MKKTCLVCGADIENHVCEDCLIFYSHKFRISKDELSSHKSFKKLIHAYNKQKSSKHQWGTWYNSFSQGCLNDCIFKKLPEGGGKKQ